MPPSPYFRRVIAFSAISIAIGLSACGGGGGSSGNNSGAADTAASGSSGPIANTGCSSCVPQLNQALSSPNLQITADADVLSTGYAYFSPITSESILAQPLGTVPVTFGTTTGRIDVVPNASTVPGIYILEIGASNVIPGSGPTPTEYDNSANFMINVLPGGQPSVPTFVSASLGGTTSAILTLASSRINLANPQLLLPDGSSPASHGLTVSNLSVFPQPNGAVTATITVNTSTFAANTNTVTDSSGTVHSNGMLLELVATADLYSNGYSPAPYTEMFYLTLTP